MTNSHAIEQAIVIIIDEIRGHSVPLQCEIFFRLQKKFKKISKKPRILQNVRKQYFFSSVPTINENIGTTAPKVIKFCITLLT